MFSCCFTGHRTIENREELQKRLLTVLEMLIKNGAADFYAGGAIGFDTLAADAVLRLRKKYPHIRLHLVLPCRRDEQTKYWTAAQRAEYDRIFSLADTAEYMSDAYSPDCMKKRNARLVKLADCCVCCYDKRKTAGGTVQTLRMAAKKGIKIINLFRDMEKIP